MALQLKRVKFISEMMINGNAASIIGSTFKNNTCSIEGSILSLSDYNAGCVIGLGTDNHAFVYDTVFENNRNMLTAQGAVAWSSGDATILFSGCTGVSNFNAGYGMIASQGASRVVSINSHWINNTASWYAGVFHAKSSSRVDVTGGSVSGNTALGYNGLGGGGVVLEQSSYAIFTGVEFKTNYARHNGGAFQVRGEASMILSGCTVTGNTAKEDGGAVSIEHDVGGYWNAEEAKLFVEHNQGHDRVPLTKFPLPEVFIQQSTFELNQAGQEGGVVAVKNAVMHIKDVIASKNQANQTGGFVSLQDKNTTVYMKNATVVHNKALETGGAIFSRTSQNTSALSSHNCASLRLNHIASQSAANACGGGTLLLSESKFEGNSANGFGGVFAFELWPNQTSPVMDQQTASATINNGAGGGGVAALLSRLALQDGKLDVVEFMSKLTTGVTAGGNTTYFADNLGGLAGGTPTLYGPKVATLGNDFTITQTNPTFQFSAGQVENPDYKIPEVVQGETIWNPDKLRLLTVFKDGFGQTVASADDAICYITASIDGNQAGTTIKNRFTNDALSVGSGTTKIILSQGESMNSNLRLQAYLAPLGVNANHRHLFEKKATNVTLDCTEKIVFNSISENERIFTDSTVQTSVVPSDCPTGYVPLYSRDTNQRSCPGMAVDPGYCDVVQLCAPCNPGFFSAELNTQCQICPAGSVSSEASFGINGCNCPSAKYIEYWKYSSSPYIPPANPAMSKDLSCLPCTTGGTCTQIDANGALVSTYPYPLPGYWQPQDNIIYQSVTWKGQTIQTPIDNGPKAIYDCPFGSCLGGLEPNCSAGYHGHVCGICDSGHELTVNGCRECNGAGSYVILMILCAILVPVGLCGLYVGGIIQSAQMKLSLMQEAARVFKLLDYKRKGFVSNKYLHAVYSAMSTDEKVLVKKPSGNTDTVVHADFIALILDGKMPQDLIPEERDSAVKNLAAWDSAAQQLADQRLQVALANALAHYQNADLNQDLLQAAMAQNNDLPQMGDDGEDNTQGVDVEEHEELEEELEEEEEDIEEEIEEEEEEDPEGDWGEEDDEDPLEDLTAQMKIVAAHFQVVGGSLTSMKIDLPSATQSLVSIGNTFSLDVFSIFAIDCIQRVTFYQKMHFFLAVPVSMGIIYYIGLCLIKKCFTSVPEEDFVTFMINKFMIIMFMFYPALCAILLGIFECREIEGVSWLIADLTIECYTSTWATEALVACVGILLLPIGFPVVIYTTFSRNRHRLHSDMKFRNRFGFMYNRYEAQYWFWESTEMLRKFLLCGVLIFVQPGSMLQLAASILLASLFLTLHSKFQPFEDDIDDDLQSAALLATFLTLISSTLIKTNESGPMTTTFIMLINLSVFCIAVYALIMDTIPSIIEKYTLQWDKAMRIGDDIYKLSNLADETATMESQAVVSSSGKSGSSQDITKENESSETDLDVQIERLFMRYDLDGSGTINSWDELEQLCCNLGYRLELDLNPTEIDEIIDTVKAANDEIEWDLPTFSAWFKQKFALT